MTRIKYGVPRTPQRLKEASLEEIAAVEGMNQAAAVKLYEGLHGVEMRGFLKGIDTTVERDADRF